MAMQNCPRSSRRQDAPSMGSTQLFRRHHTRCAQLNRPVIFAVTFPSHELIRDFRFFSTFAGAKGRQCPPQTGHNFKAAPPTRRIWWTHSSQNALSQSMHAIVAWEVG